MSVVLPKFFLAVDDAREEAAWDKLNKIKNVSGSFGVKFNLDLIIDNLEIIRRFKSEFQNPLFVDLKMWNGQRTMSEVVKKIAMYGADMVNVYAHAAMMLKKPTQIAVENGMFVLGVTVLTHYTEKYCQRVYGKSIDQTVRILSVMALENGCHGIILPGTTLHAVSDFECIKFNPAVRPDWFKDKKTNTQEQIMSPTEAIKKGATIVSCGSPVFKSPDPAEALKLILDEVNVI